MSLKECSYCTILGEEYFISNEFDCLQRTDSWALLSKLRNVISHLASLRVQEWYNHRRELGDQIKKYWISYVWYRFSSWLKYSSCRRCYIVDESCKRRHLTNIHYPICYDLFIGSLFAGSKVSTNTGRSSLPPFNYIGPIIECWLLVASVLWWYIIL